MSLLASFMTNTNTPTAVAMTNVFHRPQPVRTGRDLLLSCRGRANPLETFLGGNDQPSGSPKEGNQSDRHESAADNRVLLAYQETNKQANDRHNKSRILHLPTSKDYFFLLVRPTSQKHTNRLGITGAQLTHCVTVRTVCRSEIVRVFDIKMDIAH